MKTAPGNTRARQHREGVGAGSLAEGGREEFALFNWFLHLMVVCQLRRYLEKVKLIHMGQKQLLIFNQNKMLNRFVALLSTNTHATSRFLKDLGAQAGRDH